MKPAQIEPFSWYNPQKTVGLIKIYIAQASTAEIAEKGRLFGLLQINETIKNNAEDLKWLEKIFKDLEKHYYSSNKEAAAALEETLQNINFKISEMIENQQEIFDLDNFQALIGLLQGQNLHLAVVGKIQAYLFHQTAKDYKIINILESTAVEKMNDSGPHPLKIFSNVITGTVGADDVLFFATESVFDYISLDKIKKTTTTLTPEGATELLKNLLIEASEKTIFGGLTIKLSPTKKTEAKETRAKTAKPVASHTSVEELIATENRTNELLSPALASNLKKFLKSGLKQLSSTLRNRKSNQPTQQRKRLKAQAKTYRARPRQTAGYLKTGWDIGQTLIEIVLKVVIWGVKLIWKVILLLVEDNEEKTVEETGKKELAVEVVKKKLDETLLSARNKSQGIKIKLRTLPRSSKILLIISLVFVLLFIQSLFFLNRKQAKEENLQHYQEIIIEIEEKINLAEGRIIFHDKAGAKILLEEGLILLQELPPDSTLIEKQYATLESKIKVQLDDIRQIINIPNPTLVTSFANLATPGTSLETKGMVGEGNNLYIFSRDAIYQFDLNLKEVKERAVGIESGLTAAAAREDLIIFYTTAGKIGQLGAGLNWHNLSLADGAEITALDLYNDKLYLLDTANNQIWKYSRVGESFGNAREWRKDGVIDLKSARSLSIDGYIYAALADGTIYKMLTGNLIAFKANGVDPVFNAPTQIYTSDVIKYLYVLEPAEKRVVVLTKEGDLVAQYYSASFNNLKSFVVDETVQKIYLLNGPEVYEIMLSHLGT